MNIDIRTLAFIMGFTGILQVIAIYLQYLLNKTYQGIGWWLLWSASSAAGLLCLLLRDIVPVGLISASIFLSNILLLAGQIFLYIGIMRFLDKKENRGIIIAVFTIFIISTFYVLYVYKDDNARTLILYAAAAIFAFLAARGLFVNKARSFTASANFISAVLFTYGCYFALRAIAAVTVSQIDSVFTPTLIQIATFLVMLTTGFLCTLGLIIMISQRSNAEMKEANEQFELIFNTGPDATLITRPKDGIIVNINEGFTALTGYTREETVGKSSLAINLWKDPADRQNIVNELGKTGFCDNYEAFFQLKDGSQIDGTMSAKIITLQGVQHIISVTRDITAPKRAEEALRKSEAQYRLLAEHTADIVALMDMDFNIIYQSPSSEKLRGYTSQELKDLPLEKNLAPESLQLALETLYRELPCIEADPGYNPVTILELEYYRKDGTTVWLESKFSIIRDVGGKPLSTLLEARDITERRQADKALRESEEKYRLLVENASLGIIVIVDGMLKFANNRVVEGMGYSQEEITARPFIEFIHPDDRQVMAERYIQRISGRGDPNPNSFRIISKSGDIKWAEISAMLVNWDGKPATLNFLTDITEHKRLEEEQQRVTKLESVGLLAGGIAHDFNNILTSILGNISLASMEAAPGSDLQNSLEQAEKASLRAKALTVQLLTFSKGGAPALKLASLTELLRDTAGFALSGSKVKCNFSIPADLWHAEIDAGQVSQVIQNLVINAQQAMPAGGSIEIIAENINLSKSQSLGRGLPLEEGHYIRIAITDHGIGIPKDHLEKIFDPFFTTKQKGKGMGLAISFSIARQHGGYISVESELGTGSTFYLYLPASVQTSTPKENEKEAAKPAGKARILVMDDEKGVREIAGRMLKHIGYKDIEFAEDGAEAIKLYKSAMETGNPFTVAVLDLTIAGGMGGEVAIQKLLKIDPEVKAVVSSGYIDDPVIAKYKDHGFSGMVVKPYTLAELRKAVQDVIG